VGGMVSGKGRPRTRHARALGLRLAWPRGDARVATKADGGVTRLARMCTIPVIRGDDWEWQNSRHKPSEKMCGGLHQSQTKSSWGGSIAPALGAEPDPR
jgi:hypothetical protein